MKKTAFWVLVLSPVLAFAQTPSRDWSGSYSFPQSSSSSLRLLQADLIEKKEGGYYDSFGPGSVNVWSYSTTTAGSIINNSTEITGDGNRVISDGTAYNSGNLNGSINFTSNSVITSTDSKESKLIFNQPRIDE
jgi:hypothetical protein